MAARPLVPAHAVRIGWRQSWSLLLELSRTEVASQHRFTLLGWLWPLVRQLAQLGVLVFVFDTLIDVGIPDYPVFVFSGLLAWSWFQSGVGGAASSLAARRHLVFQARVPAAVLPLVALAVPLVDVLLALPVLLVMLVADGDLGPTALLFPLLLAVQLVLMAGLAWLTAAATVYLRDIPNVVTVTLLMLFYMTPVFYSLDRIPDRFHWVLLLNPLATLLGAYRDVLIAGQLPDTGAVLAVAGVSVAIAVAGLAVFRRLEGGFVDEL